MRIRTRHLALRSLLFTSVAAMLVIGPIGCGSDSSTNGTSSGLPPEAAKANSNMEDFVKQQQEKK